MYFVDDNLCFLKITIYWLDIIFIFIDMVIPASYKCESMGPTNTFYKIITSNDKDKE